MLFNELFGPGNEPTIVVALVSLMGASLSIAFAMAMVINYLDEPIASKRQIVLTSLLVLIGFYAVVNWPDEEPLSPLPTIQRLGLVSMDTTPRKDTHAVDIYKKNGQIQ